MKSTAHSLSSRWSSGSNQRSAGEDLWYASAISHRESGPGPILLFIGPCHARCIMGGFDDSRYFVDRGGYIERQQDSGVPLLIPFPVCLAIKYGENIRAECPDFVLNIEKSWVFIKAAEPLPVGTSLLLHFYVPPEDKLLAEIRGRVIQVNNVLKAFPKGMLVHFSFFSQRQLSSLGAYLEGKKPLVDRQA